MTSFQTEQVKVAVFDIDDTLLPRGKTMLSEKVKATIRQLHQRAIITLIATGRGIYNTPEEIIQVLKPPFMITINGHVIINQQRQMLAESLMSADLAAKLLSACIENEITLIFKYADRYQTVYDRHTHPNRTLPSGNPYGCFLVPPPSFPMMTLSEKFPELSFTKSPAGYDVYEGNADKSTGIEIILQELNLSWKNVMCFGDAENDLTMIQKAGLGIAMGNACDSLKKEADAVCGSSLDDGITTYLNSCFF